jgi:hypothetical protein
MMASMDERSGEVDAQQATEPLPPATTARDALARAKGMPGAEIAGGTDPDLEATLARERPYVRLLILMVVAIALAGFLLGAIAVTVSGILRP